MFILLFLRLFSKFFIWVFVYLGSGVIISVRF